MTLAVAWYKPLVAVMVLAPVLAGAVYNPVVPIVPPVPPVATAQVKVGCELSATPE